MDLAWSWWSLRLWRGYFWPHNERRQQALEALTAFESALTSTDHSRLPELVILPHGIQSRTAAEQIEFLRKALRDEVTSEGIDLLRREGEFGALTDLFPDEAIRWAEQAGVRPEDCVAFKLERNGLRTEVVLAKDSAPRAPPAVFKVVRCNNVKALEAVEISTTEQP